jgi:hypothetical protein
MIALSGTSPARESCDQTKTWTIFGVHGQDENGLVNPLRSDRLATLSRSMPVNVGSGARRSEEKLQAGTNLDKPRPQVEAQASPPGWLRRSAHLYAAP